MKLIAKLLLKKRWYLFLIIAFIAFFMNFFLWNEATQAIRAYERLERMQEEVKRESYEFLFQSKAAPSGMVTPLTQNQKEQLVEVLSETFFTPSHVGMLYSEKNRYLNGELAAPARLDEEELRHQVLDQDSTLFLFNDFIIRSPEKAEMRTLVQKFQDMGVDIIIRPFSEVFKLERDYYYNNFIFGCCVASLLSIFASFLIYRLAKASVHICKEEIKVFRLVGMPQNRIVKQFLYIFVFPIIVSFILFLFFIHVVLPFGVILADYVYLSLLNFLLIFCAYWMTKRQLRGVFND